MNKFNEEDKFDVIIVGSGTCGATISRELVKNNKKVLILEQGADIPLKETLSGILAVAQEFLVGDKLKVTTASTAGGSTSLYLGVCKLPTPETFKKLGIDLSEEFEEVKNELPIAELPDELLSPQTIMVRDSAKELGYLMTKNHMLVDQTKCDSRSYSYEAKWKAKSYLQEAIEQGAILLTQAKVIKVIIENGQAIGVEYKLRKGFMKSRVCRTYGAKIVLAGGSFSSPKLLMESGLKGIGNHGFFCKPAFMVCGTVPGLKGKDAFVGSLDTDLVNGVNLGDAALSSTLFKLVMFSNFRWGKIFSHSNTISIGILLYDSMGGEIKKDGRYYKKLTPEEAEKLKNAEGIAKKILKNAGAINIFKTKLVAGNPGGVLRINENFDGNMQTKISNLYICDHSLISDTKITPTITLICLGKYMAKHLISSLHAKKLTKE